MFVVILRYIADLSEIDAAREAHMAWLAEGYEAGVFVASGRQEPRVGGVILAGGLTRDALEERLAGDPFAQRGLAESEIVEFVVGSTAPGLEALSAL